MVPDKIKISSRPDFSMSCFSSVLHYGQAIFEGIKAHRLSDGRIGIFRLKDHSKRFKNSAKIMDMPELDENIFNACIEKFVECCKKIIPHEQGHSLYIRPLMFANDSIIKVRSGENFRFIVMASVVGPYFSSGNTGSKVLINNHFVRAFPFGAGEAKTSANYALSLPALHYAQKHGFEQVLYLDAKTKKNIDELGGMNFFMVKNDKIITPKLNGTILAGITRDTILKIAEHLKIPYEEKDLTLEEVLNTNDHQGLFACGTAATVVPIIEIGYQENFDDEIKRYSITSNEVIEKLRRHLTMTQLNNSSMSKNWLTYIK